MKKNKYDTSVVMLYQLGMESELPYSFRKQIPYSTISSWRKTDYTSFMGHEFRQLLLEGLEYSKVKRKQERSASILKAIRRCWRHSDYALQIVKKCAQRDLELQHCLILSVEALSRELGLKSALQLFNISRAQYYRWATVVKTNCSYSHQSSCVRKYPSQLRKTEITKMKRLLTDKAYESWPIVSIAGYGMRAGSVVASLFTWYRYAKIFGITKHLELKPRKTAGLKPAHPNEYLHVDTTYYQMNEVERICITFVIDSYSKMILGYALAANLSFKIVKTALENAASTILNHPEKVQSYLVADGAQKITILISIRFYRPSANQSS